MAKPGGGFKTLCQICVGKQKARDKKKNEKAKRKREGLYAMNMLIEHLKRRFEECEDRYFEHFVYQCFQDLEDAFEEAEEAEENEENDESDESDATDIDETERAEMELIDTGKSQVIFEYRGRRMALFAFTSKFLYRRAVSRSDHLYRYKRSECKIVHGTIPKPAKRITSIQKATTSLADIESEPPQRPEKRQKVEVAAKASTLSHPTPLFTNCRGQIIKNNKVCVEHKRVVFEYRGKHIHLFAHDKDKKFFYDHPCEGENEYPAQDCKVIEGDPYQ